MNFVMADGHVKWIARYIDANIYLDLATIRGARSSAATRTEPSFEDSRGTVEELPPTMLSPAPS